MSNCLCHSCDRIKMRLQSENRHQSELQFVDCAAKWNRLWLCAAHCQNDVACKLFGPELQFRTKLTNESGHSETDSDCESDSEHTN